MQNPEIASIDTRRAFIASALCFPVLFAFGCEDSEVASVPKIPKSKVDKDTGIIEPRAKGKGSKKR